MTSLLILGRPTEDFVRGLIATHGDITVKVLTGEEVKSARDVFFSDLFQWVLEEKPFVVTYSAGWQGETSVLSETFAHLTGRSPEAIQYFLFDMGVEVKSHSLTKGLLSIKDLMAGMDQTQLGEPQRLRFQILGELIR